MRRNVIDMLKGRREGLLIDGVDLRYIDIRLSLLRGVGARNLWRNGFFLLGAGALAACSGGGGGSNLGGGNFSVATSQAGEVHADNGDTVHAASGERFGLFVDLSQLSPIGLGGTFEGDKFDGIENLVGGMGDDTFTGNLNDNKLSGLDGDDKLYGMEGDDMLMGGVGGDTLDGGIGFDTADYSDNSAGVTIILGGSTALPSQALAGGDFGSFANHDPSSLVGSHSSSAFGGTADGDDLISIENLIGGSGDDDLTGNLLANKLEGMGGADILRGVGGADRLHGGVGDDELYGGAGGDALFGGVGDDRLEGGLGEDVLRGESGVDTLLGGGGVDRLFGGEGADILDGGSENDILDGGSGADVLDGGSGDDRLFGGVGADIFMASSGRDVVIDFVASVDRLLFDNYAHIVTEGDLSVGASKDGFLEISFDSSNDGVKDSSVIFSNLINSLGLDIITATGLNVRPVIASSSVRADIVEGSTASIFRFTASDADSGTSFTYSISGGADSGLFSIDEHSGDISFIVGADYETPLGGVLDDGNLYSISVVVSDGLEDSLAREFIVNVLDVNDEVPTFTLVNPSVTAPENMELFFPLYVRDGDATDTVSNLEYTLSGIGASLFKVEDGVLKFADFGLDYENDYERGPHIITVSVSDELHVNDEIVVTITIEDVEPERPNLRPEFDGSLVSVYEIDEGVTAANIFTVTASDDGLPLGGSLSYSLAGVYPSSESGNFSIDSASGVVSIIGGLDYKERMSDSNNVVVLSVRANDGLLTNVYEYTIDVKDDPLIDPVTSPIFALGLDVRFTVTEGVSGVLFTASANDADGDSLTYSLSGDSSGFSVDVDSGVVSVVDGLNYDEGAVSGSTVNERLLTVMVSDGGLDATDTVSHTFTVEIEDDPLIVGGGTLGGSPAAFAVGLSDRLTVTEGVSGSFFTASANDADGDSLEFILTGDTAGFSIDSGSGVVSVVSGLDYDETAISVGVNERDLTVLVSDGGFSLTDTVSHTFTVEIEDDPFIGGGTFGGSPPLFASGLGVNFMLNEGISGSFLTASASDPDGDSIKFSLSGDTAGFSIDAGSGVVSVVSGLDYDETAGSGSAVNERDLTVLVSDGGIAASFTVSHSFRVVIVNDTSDDPAFPPGLVGSSFVSVGEHETFRTFYRVEGSDANGDVLSYSFTGGADSDLFFYDSVSRGLRFRDSVDSVDRLDSDGDGVYELEFLISDGTLDSQESLSFTVTDVSFSVATSGVESHTGDLSNGFGVSAAAGDSASLTIDLSGGGVSIGSGGSFAGDSFSDIANVVGGDGVDTLIGGDEDNIFEGGAGGDIITGGGGSGSDVASYAGDDVGVTVMLQDDGGASGTMQISGGDSAGDVLVGIENLVGGIGDDRLVGGAGVNILDGGAGDDILAGGAGGDILIGGSGSDVVLYERDTSGVTILLQTDGSASGTSQISGGLAEGDLLSGIEDLTGGSGVDDLTGNSGSNRLLGGSGDDILSGGGGDDELDGGVGDDELTGGVGADIFMASVGSDTIVDFTVGEVLSFNNFAGITDMVSADFTVGVSGTDLRLSFDIDGLGSGNERGVIIFSGISASVGDADSIFSSVVSGSIEYVRARHFLGTSDADILVGTASSFDSIDYSGVGAVTGGLGLSFSDGGGRVLLGDAGSGSAGDRLESIEHIIGSRFDDSFVSLSGGYIFDGGVGVDRVSYGSSAVGVTVTLDADGDASGTAEISGGYASGDILRGIENLAGGSGADTFTGNDGNNVFGGGEGDDVLMGGAGDDSLVGNGGDDTLMGGTGADGLVGGGGDDILIGGAGRDYIDGLAHGSGGDTVSYAGSVGGVTVTLDSSGHAYGAGAPSGGDAAGDTVFNVENIIGGNGADILGGNGGANRLDGGSGIDKLSGGFGDDTLNGGSEVDGLYGGAGNDTLNGDGGSDILYGGAGADTLNGGTGADILHGGFGDNRLTGGLGADTFIVSGGIDRISDFNAAADVIWFRDYSHVVGVDNFVLRAGDDLKQSLVVEFRLDDNDATPIARGSGNGVIVFGNSSFGSNSTPADIIDSAPAILNDLVANGYFRFHGEAGSGAIRASDAVETHMGSAANFHRVNALSFERADLVVDLSGGESGTETIIGSGGVFEGDTFIDIHDLVGGLGDDTFTASDDANEFDGGGGTNTVSYGNSDAGVVINLGVLTQVGSGHGVGDVLKSIDNIIGSADNDTLIGDAEVNDISGGGGADTLDGGGGDDILSGGSGADIFVASSGDDIVMDFSFSDGDMVSFEGHSGITGKDNLTFSSTAGGDLVIGYVVDVSGGSVVQSSITLEGVIVSGGDTAEDVFDSLVLAGLVDYI